MRKYLSILLCLLLPTSLFAQNTWEYTLTAICESMAEDGSVENMEEFHNELEYIHLHPININRTNRSELSRLRFLSDQQIDNLLEYIYYHPMDSLQELRLIPGFRPYEIQDLAYFITIEPVEQDKQWTRLGMLGGHHELLLRTDIRNAEHYSGDPVYLKIKYQYNNHNRLLVGIQAQRDAGTSAHDLQFGGYAELRDIGPFRTIVLGNYQAQFGQGLVTASGFHMGKSSYVLTAGTQEDGLRRYSGNYPNSLHGLGATATIPIRQPHATFDLSAWYSLAHTNDTIRRHVLGSNATYRWNQLKLGFTFVQNFYSDTLRYYYENATYNQNYFRGIRQTVLGLNFRYNFGHIDLFGEVATAQNRTQWGVAATVGSRLIATDGIGLMLLYRYYSPTYDNTLGYAFSETSRINDENGIYCGLDITRLRYWRFAAYGDFFRFSGIKYGIPYFPSYGYDAMLQTEWLPGDKYNMQLRLRAREKARLTTCSARYQFNWQQSGWHLRTQAEANLTVDSLSHLNYGYTIWQDVAYTFRRVPFKILLRLAGFNAQKWNNRIYCYEHDVLYGYSIPALYGRGGRAYLNLRWKAVDTKKIRLAVYLRASETVYYDATHRTDIHTLLRFTF